MRKNRWCTLDIGGEETADEFLRRLIGEYDDVPLVTLNVEVRFQMAWRELERAQTVDQLKSVMYLMLKGDV